MKKTFTIKHLVLSFLLGSLFFSGVGYAASSATNIEVYFQPLKYFFDGIEKKSPDDQQGFIYNGTTYVPLRFVAESLGQKVGYDGPTNSIYVGKQKEGEVTYMEEMKTLTLDKSNSFAVNPVSNFETNTGEKFIHGYARTSMDSCCRSHFKAEYLLNGQYKKIEAFIAPYKDWKSREKTNDIGRVKIYGDEKLLFDSGAVPSDVTKAIPVNVELTGVLKLRVEMTNTLGIGFLDAKFIN